MWSAWGRRCGSESDTGEPGSTAQTSPEIAGFHPSGFPPGSESTWQVPCSTLYPTRRLQDQAPHNIAKSKESNMKAVLSALVLAIAAMSLASCASKTQSAPPPVDMGMQSYK